MGSKNSGVLKGKKTGGAHTKRGLLLDAQNLGKKSDMPSAGDTARGFLSWAAEVFNYELFDERACRAWVFGRLHPEGARCPACELVLDGAGCQSFWAGRRCVCRRCGRKFTARSGTLLDGSQLDYRQVYVLAAFSKIGLTPARLAEILNVTPNTVRYWSLRFDVFNKNENENEGGR